MWAWAMAPARLYGVAEASVIRILGLMHTVTTHGLLYGIVLFCVLLKILFMSARACQFAIAPCCFILVLILIDWNVNANLYQPYYAAMFALLLNAISSRSFNLQSNKAEIS